jgi:CRP-like cAMP-binding protein
MSGEDGEIRQYKRGELIFQENQKATHVYLIQKGQVQVFLQRGPHKVDLMTYYAPQIVGEQAIFGSKTYAFSAEASVNSTLIASTVEQIKDEYGRGSAPMKLLLKSLSESLKVTSQTIKSERLEQDKSPCPQVFISRLFASISYTCHRFGAKEKDIYSITWGALRNTAIRFFLESSGRAQSILQILEKLGLAELIYVVNADDEQELANIRIHDIGVIDGFVDFYSGELYKKGRSEMLYVDPHALEVVQLLCQQTADMEQDFRGATKIKLKDVVEFQKNHGLSFKQNDVDLLKNKGLFVDQKTGDDGVVLSFDRHEFNRIRGYWEIILEIDRWNERGIVLKQEPVEKKSMADRTVCPECDKEVDSDAKFCSGCGFKLCA